MSDPQALGERYRRLRRQVAVGDLDRVAANYHGGRLRWLVPVLGADTYRELGRRLEEGDHGWVERTVSAADPARGRNRPPPSGRRIRRRRPSAGLPGPWWQRLNWPVVLVVVLSLVALAAVLSRCAGGGDDDGDAAPADDASVVEAAGKNDDLSTFTSLLEDAGLASTLGEGGPYTVFAPSNAAFAELGTATLDALRADPAGLSQLLSGHVIEGSYALASFDGGGTTSLAGTPLDIQVDGDTVTVGGAVVLRGDIEADNGTVHVLGAVLIDADQSAAGDHVVYFDSGSSTVGPEGQEVIEAAAEQIRATRSSGTVTITGYTDGVGNPTTNEALAERRAAAVRDALVAAVGDTTVTFSIGPGGVDTSGDPAASRRAVIELP